MRIDILMFKRPAIRVVVEITCGNENLPAGVSGDVHWLLPEGRSEGQPQTHTRTVKPPKYVGY